jgi:hypothetical protein
MAGLVCRNRVPRALLGDSELSDVSGVFLDPDKPLLPLWLAAGFAEGSDRPGTIARVLLFHPWRKGYATTRMETTGLTHR